MLRRLRPRVSEAERRVEELEAHDCDEGLETEVEDIRVAMKNDSSSGPRGRITALVAPEGAAQAPVAERLAAHMSSNSSSWYRRRPAGSSRISSWAVAPIPASIVAPIPVQGRGCADLKSSTSEVGPIWFGTTKRLSNVEEVSSSITMEALRRT